MSNMMNYKGYDGSVTYSDEDKVFFGKLEGLRDLVSFEGTDVKSLEAAFHEAVDDYLASCAESGKQPDKPYKGQFNVRIDPEIHRGLVLVAQESGLGNLNAVVEDALRVYVHDHLVTDMKTHKKAKAALAKKNKAAKRA